MDWFEPIVGNRGLLVWLSMGFILFVATGGILLSLYCCLPSEKEK